MDDILRQIWQAVSYEARRHPVSSVVLYGLRQTGRCVMHTPPPSYSLQIETIGYLEYVGRHELC